MLEIGPHKFKVWAHRGKDLEECNALRLNYSFLALLFERMRKFGWEFGQKLDTDGRLMMHGE